MVSPVFKDGASFSHSRAGVSVSPNGESVIAVALGSFAGAESDTYENAAYQLTRTAQGWVAKGIAPPAAMSPESLYYGSSTDLSRTLWGLHRASQSIYEEDLYIREADGRFVEVGPMVPPSFGSGPPSGTTSTFGRNNIHTLYIQGGGASSDLSHVVVNIEGEGELIGDRWPGDETLGSEGSNSLYEYSGVGLARPALVGVDNFGRQISQCSTYLGSPGAHFNAVSPVGDRVFFTAAAGGCSGVNLKGEAATGTGPAVATLYARVGGLETVPISEPTFSQCRFCRTGVPTPEEPSVTEAPAAFAGASEDGTKVFFTTEQELLEGQTTNNLYEYDFNNPTQKKVVLASVGSSLPEVQGVVRISENGSHVYFVAKSVLTEEPNLSLPDGHQIAVAGEDNLYVFERDAAFPAGRVRFVATLPSADEKLWSLFQGHDERPAQTTPDGRFLVFASEADLTADDTSSVAQIFEYDSQTEKLVRVSVGQCVSAAPSCAPDERLNDDGNTSTQPAAIVAPSYGLGDLPAEAGSTMSVSNDGSSVFFTSAAELATGAAEASSIGAQSVYEYHSEGAIDIGDVHLVSDGKDATRETNNRALKGTELIATDGSGADVFLQSGDSLVAGDLNAGRDIFDARMDGGFPMEVAAGSCSGEACRGGGTSPPSIVTPASASAQGGGNLPTGAPAPPVAPRPVSRKRPATRAQMLAKALYHCRHGAKRRRHACENRALRAFGRRHSKMTARGSGK
jgi:hypothetical protein